MAKLKMHIRRGDIVKAISGADADGKKTGKVLKVYPETNRRWWRIHFVKKHLRSRRTTPTRHRRGRRVGGPNLAV
jgi:ribosomal protein L24